ncbi:hypothetical protein ACH5RR_001105 [Cinchona calisaya]|uniref:Uncharacterized protein n=1 Tax=Cinchona calisaya TaxID=153742 RepID=A0ABD3B3N2_9GENT
MTTFTSLRSLREPNSENFNDNLHRLEKLLETQLAMVMFKELTTSDKKYLLIVDHDGDEVTQLLVHDPTHGNFAGDWPSQNRLHFDE